MEKTTTSIMTLADIKPALSIADTKKFFALVQEAKDKLLTESDFIVFRDKEGNEHKAPKKSGILKLSLYFGISTRCEPAIYQEVHGEVEEYVYQVQAVASAFGRETSGMGACSNLEKSHMDQTKAIHRKRHDVLSHAETRATNRAICKWLALTEVSAEELEGSDEMTSKNVGIGDPSIASNFCQVAGHKTSWNMTTNKCAICNKMCFMP